MTGNQDYRNDVREAQKNFFWTLPRVLGGAVVVIVAIYLLLVALTPLTIGFGWFKGEANLRSFNHVQQTYQQAYDDVNSMEANVRQSCRFKAEAADAKVSGDTITYNQRQTQLLAIENNFDRIKGEYEAYMTDHFRGGVIRPAQLPLPYPSLEERQTTVCASSSK